MPGACRAWNPARTRGFWRRARLSFILSWLPSLVFPCKICSSLIPLPLYVQLSSDRCNGRLRCRATISYAFWGFWNIFDWMWTKCHFQLVAWANTEPTPLTSRRFSFLGYNWLPYSWLARIRPCWLRATLTRPGYRDSVCSTFTNCWCDELLQFTLWSFNDHHQKLVTVTLAGNNTKAWFHFRLITFRVIWY